MPTLEDTFNKALEAFNAENYTMTATLLESLTRSPEARMQPSVWRLLGTTKSITGELCLAQQCMQNALKINIKDELAWVGLAEIYSRQGEAAEALNTCIKGISHLPDYIPLYRMFCDIILKTGLVPSDWRSFAHNLDMRHLKATLKSLHEENKACASAIRTIARTLAEAGHIKVSLDLYDCTFYPVKSSLPVVNTSFVKKKFKEISSTYDEDPWSMDVAKKQFIPFIQDVMGEKKGLSIMDLACGTGLLADELRPRATYLAGIDISQEMINLAKNKDLYDDIFCGNMSEVLRQTKKSFDLITCNWALFYLSDLTDLFSVVSAHLTQGGRFLATVYPCSDTQDVMHKELDQEEFCHSHAYIKRLTQDVQLTEKTMEIRRLASHLGIYFALEKK